MNKFLAYSGLILMAGMILMGCGSDTDQTAEDTEVTRISFSWWGNDKRHTYTMDGVEAFESLNPDIEVSLRYGEWNGYETRNRIYMESHTQSDVMQINYSWLSQYSPDGEGYYDLYTLGDTIDLSAYPEEYLSYGEVDGKLNGIPIAMNTSTVYFNKTLLAQYGLEVPETFEEYYECAEVLAEHDIYLLGAQKKQMMILLYSYYEQTTGKKAFNDAGELLLDEDDIAVILETYKDMVAHNVLQPVSDFNRNDFGTGKIAGTVIWISDVTSYCNLLTEAGSEPALANYPSVANAVASGLYIKPATLYAISKDTAEPETAAKLLNYLVSNPDMALLQGTEKGIPINEQALETLQENDALTTNEYDAYQLMNAESDSMTMLYPAYENDDALTALKDGLEKYLYDQDSLEVISAEVVAGINKALGN